jgi:hypothetical protein
MLAPRNHIFNHFTKFYFYFWVFTVVSLEEISSNDMNIHRGTDAISTQQAVCLENESLENIHVRTSRDLERRQCKRAVMLPICLIQFKNLDVECTVISLIPTLVCSECCFI